MYGTAGFFFVAQGQNGDGFFVAYVPNFMHTVWKQPRVPRPSDIRCTRNERNTLPAAVVAIFLAAV